MSGTALMKEVGYAKFSARGAAARMGYTVGTLYHLFGNLETYILHLNARTLEEWHTQLSASLRATKGDPVKCLAKGYMEFAAENYNRFTALFDHQVKDVPEWYRPKMQQLFALVEGALDSKTRDARKTRHLAKVLWASIHGITILSLSGKLEVVGADAAEKLVETVIKGLSAA